MEAGFFMDTENIAFSVNLLFFLNVVARWKVLWGSCDYLLGDTGQQDLCLWLWVLWLSGAKLLFDAWGSMAG
ncbi:hypothetical protein CI610_00688 [invertebrate metagenome]|uniref:Uncharacterized protein n=1 Tax=invertebrate metagenome TaxID=1711999 RepID=A0A2H9TAU5_9ZZZZ